MKMKNYIFILGFGCLLLVNYASGLRAHEVSDENIDFELIDENENPTHVCKRQDFQQVKEMKLSTLFKYGFEYTDVEKEYIDQGYQPMEVDSTVVFCKPLCHDCECHLKHLMQNINYGETLVDFFANRLKYGTYSHVCTTISTYINETVIEACNVTKSTHIVATDAFFHQINEINYLCWHIRFSDWRVQSFVIIDWGMDKLQILGFITLAVGFVVFYKILLACMNIIKYLDIFEAIIRQSSRRRRRNNQQVERRHQPH